MTAKRKLLVAAFAAAVVAATPMGAVAQDSTDRKVEQYACKDVMREGGTNRDNAIAFLHGFTLGKSGGSAFSLEKLTMQTDAFIDHCLDNPGDKALDAMMKVKG